MRPSAAMVGGSGALLVVVATIAISLTQNVDAAPTRASDRPLLSGVVQPTNPQQLAFMSYTTCNTKVGVV